MSFVTDYNCFTPLGEDLEATFSSLEKGESGIRLHEHLHWGQSPFFASSINYSFPLIAGFTRLETMLIRALKPLIGRNPVKDKALLMVSTTKGNITSLQTENLPEEAYLYSTAKKLADYFGFDTTPIVLSNACVSGILAVAVAKRFIDAGMYEQVFIVAGDEISEFVFSGFSSFQAVSDNPCRPYDKFRNGVTLGEAAAAVLISKYEGKFKISGEGSINDANHISGPSRTGEGLYRSVKAALNEASLLPDQIDFVSAHGTATIYNDEMEAIAFNRLGMNAVPLNSMKGYFGHTLGASGLLEAVISFEASERELLIPSYGFEESGVSTEINVIRKKEHKQIRRFLKTASGFGGCNTAVIFEKVE